MPDYKDYGYNSDNFNHVHAYILQPILDLLSNKQSRTILDLGCGNGWLTNLLIDKGYTAYGTDASVTGINIAKQKNRSHFFVQDLTTKKLPDELSKINFDTIISTEVIEHIYAPRDYLNFCKAVLEKSGGGDLILTTPYHGYLKNLVMSITNKMDKHFTVLWDGGHIKFWSRKTLYSILLENGFDNIEFKGCGRIPYLWKSMMIKACV